jgi:hypothetical protein
MGDKNLIITPKTKVGELLDSYPQLESLLIELSPVFARLRNPVLRRTVARVATLQQASAIGGLKVDELVNRLRKEAGQNEFSGDAENIGYLETESPSWFDEQKIVIRFDATPLINAGENPMSRIFSTFQPLQPGEIAELTTPFLPAPILDQFREKGNSVFTLKKIDRFISYILKP